MRASGYSSGGFDRDDDTGIYTIVCSSCFHFCHIGSILAKERDQNGF